MSVSVMLDVRWNCVGSRYAPCYAGVVQCPKRRTVLFNLNFFVINRLNSIANTSNFAFFLRIFDEFFPDFAPNSRKE